MLIIFTRFCITIVFYSNDIDAITNATRFRQRRRISLHFAVYKKIIAVARTKYLNDSSFLPSFLPSFPR